ncbi:type II secretion system minor pseudopilin GspK [Sphingobium subterraneum]|uniref:Type II secretion system protein K n=1 Tax=Sphingobium subterraneum TaxID=627688 RepID=A0A841IUU8_9SPHN|nr:general secretion pathway protein K [Sphingobium subterraneum]
MPDRRTTRARERGAALLTVLLLVAIMAVIAAAAMERLTIATRLSANVVAGDQAQATADSASVLVAHRLDALIADNPTRLTLQSGWMGRAMPIDIGAGQGTITLVDGGNCFNLNSLVAGSDESDLSVRPVGVTQFRTLMQLLGVDARAATRIAAATADWIDTDDKPQDGGAEDETYQRAPSPYRTANRFMADESELRAVAGVTPAVFALLRPWICALPTNGLSPININTLLPEQAPLLAMMVPGQLSVDAARQMLAQRPIAGYESPAAFWRVPALAGLTPPAEVAEQVRVVTMWFRAEVQVNMGGTTAATDALYYARVTPVRLIRRTRGTGE